MTLNEIRNFLAVADTGSIRAAARVRGLSPPAVTQSIARLEEEFHLPVIVRSSLGVSLTEFGNVLLQRARAIVAQVDGASDDAAQLLGDYSGKLSLGASIVSGITVLPGALRQFRQDYPNVKVDLSSSIYQSHIASLRAGEMDLAITTMPHFEAYADICVERLYETELVILIGKHSVWAGARSLGDLVHAEWIVLSGGPSGADTIVEAFVRNGFQQPRAMLRGDSLMFAEVLLTEMDALTLVTRDIAQREPFASKAMILEILEPLPKLSVSLYYKADKPLLPIAAHMATLLRRYAHYFTTGQIKVVGGQRGRC